MEPPTTASRTNEDKPKSEPVLLGSRGEKDVSKERPIIIAVQLAGEEKGDFKKTSYSHRTPRKPDQVDPRRSRSTSTLDDDIELLEFSSHPAVRYSTHSTENLVPCSPVPHHSNEQLSYIDDKISSPHEHAPTQAQIPDYKPLPVRTPFLVFILVFIGGVFAFLEYHVHDLPPMRYSVLKVDPGRRPDQADGSLPTELGNFDSTPTRTVQPSLPDINPGFITITRPALRIPTPEPDPRPPDTAYPSPAAPLSYCGWYPPTWVLHIRNLEVLPCEELPFDSPGDMCPGKAGTTIDATHYMLWDIQEQIETFVTDDPSWCPCRNSVFNGTWSASELTEDLQYVRYLWDTDDEGCKSAMMVIESVNYYKWGVMYMPTTVPADGTSFAFSGTYSTPPPGAPTQLWPYPSTGADGAVMLPMVVRTAGTEVRDAFGNRVQPTETATFPASFHTRPSLRVDVGSTIPCYMQSNHAYRFSVMDDCTSVPLPTDSTSILWWQLPLSRPTSTGSSVDSQVSLTITASPTSVLESSVTTSVSVPQEASAPKQVPVCTSCNDADQPSSTTSSQTQRAPSLASETPSMVGSTSLDTSRAATHEEQNSPTSLPTTTRQAGFLTTSGQPKSMTDEPAISSSTASTSTDPVSGSPLLIPIPGQANTSENSSSTRTTTNSLTTFSAIRPSPKGPGISASDSASLPPPTTPAGSLTADTTTGPLPTASHSPDHQLGIPGLQSNNTAAPSPLPNNTPTPGHIIVNPTPTNSNTNTNTTSNNTPFYPTHPAGPVPPEVQSTFANLRSEASYLLASVIPVLLTTLLSIPIQVFSSSLNSLLPFRALTITSSSPHVQSGGCVAQDSLLLSRSPSLITSQIISLRFLARYRDPLPLCNLLLGILSLVLVPVSSEVIRLEMTADCDQNGFYDNPGRMGGTGGGNGYLRVCAFGIRKSGGLIRLAEGILVVMAVMCVWLGVLLFRWRMGVLKGDSREGDGDGDSGPWSIRGVGRLLGSNINSHGEGLAGLLRDLPSGMDSGSDSVNMREEMRSLFVGMRFRLGFNTGAGSPGSCSGRNYGLEIIQPSPEEDDRSLRLTTRDPPTRKAVAIATEGNHMQKSEKSKSVFCWSWKTWTMPNELSLRILALLFTVGLLGLILVYENSIAPDTAFERFMNSQSFGVRVLFTAFGTVISLFWGYYFSQTSESQIHRQLLFSAHQENQGLPAEKSINLSPPTDVFVGLYRSAAPHTRNFHSFNIALAALLAKFTPILLSNIPFYNTVTFKIHEACTWMAVIVLAYMVLVLGGGFLILLPNLFGLPWKNGEKGKTADIKKLPVKVDTLAGCMYYVCDSGMLYDYNGDGKNGLRHGSTGDEKRYFLGEMVGMFSGKKRVGIDYRLTR